MKKILLSTLLLPTSLYPLIVVSASNEDKKYQKNLFENKLGIEFIKQVSLENIKNWDDSLGKYTNEDKGVIKQFVKKLIKNTTDKKSIAKIIHNWICENVKYATANGPAPEIEPIKVLERKVAVCGGFSNLYKVMLDEADIANVILTGNSIYGAHQWNLIILDDNDIFYSDATWGKAYFEKTIEDFSIDHEPQKMYGVSLQTKEFEYEFFHGISVKKINNIDKQIVNIPDQVNGLEITSISNYALNNEEQRDTLSNKKLIINVGSNISKIDFESGTSLIESFKINNKNKTYSDYNGILYSKNYGTLLSVPANYKEVVTIHQNTTNFDEKQSFRANHIKKINVDKKNQNYASVPSENHIYPLYDKQLQNVISIPGGANEIRLAKGSILTDFILSQYDNLKKVILDLGINQLNVLAFNNSSVSVIELPYDFPIELVSEIKKINPKIQINVIETSKIAQALIKEKVNNIKIISTKEALKLNEDWEWVTNKYDINFLEVEYKELIDELKKYSENIYTTNIDEYNQIKNKTQPILKQINEKIKVKQKETPKKYLKSILIYTSVIVLVFIAVILLVIFLKKRKNKRK
ncbi:transglutaminase-like domain-containing protein [Metamycoplasma gateae]|uniref:Transglutaminase-like domain-containing protein n=1 Tax=Metamycoplasma gateae TaxID=35769 RepID=A0ABZ2AH74_9BACT|nr:transglutaminase-like domain-containing protein [Metamycoplasma gateae]